MTEFKRKGEGTIFRQGGGTVLHSRGPVKLGSGRMVAVMQIGDDPHHHLERLEKWPLEIIRYFESENAPSAKLAGVRAKHTVRIPEDRPEIVDDAIRCIDHLSELSRLLASEDPSPAHVMLHGFEAGRQHAVLRARLFEYDASVGTTVDANLERRRQGTPVPDKAREMFLSGASIRKVAEACGVKKNKAERWRKEILKK